jgi:hypothetical protein
MTTMWTRRAARAASISALVWAVPALAVAPTVADKHAAWHRVAQRAGFPIYRPYRTLGLKLSLLALYPCKPGTRSPSSLSVVYGKPGSKGPHFGAFESRPRICGDPDESTPVTSAVIHGARVRVRVFCRISGPKCTTKDGFNNGFLVFLREPGIKHTMIQFSSSNHITLRNFLKVARSFRRVQ